MPIITYKCPSCGARLEFDSTLQQMRCPYCESQFEVSQLPDSSELLQGEAPEVKPAEEWQLPSGTWQEGEQLNLYVYTCRTCAGQIVADENLGATSCPYCGNPIVITDRFTGSLKPDIVIPFTTKIDYVKKILAEHYKGKPFLPKRFKDDNYINEIKGVYVPFWLFSSDCETDGLYDCDKVRHWSDKEYDYTETKKYTVHRSGVVSFQHVPVDGSRQLADDLMESIEPFDYKALTQFSPAYLAGFTANKYDVDAATAIPRAEQRMKDTAADILAESIAGYSSVKTVSLVHHFRNNRVFYAMMPVWLLSTTYEGQIYSFAMNGQTSRMVGDLPVDKGLYWRYFAAIAGAVSVGFTVIRLLLALVSG